jgi:hypothetical protein
MGLGGGGGRGGGEGVHLAERKLLGVTAVGWHAVVTKRTCDGFTALPQYATTDNVTVLLEVVQVFKICETGDNSSLSLSLPPSLPPAPPSDISVISWYDYKRGTLRYKP